MKSNLYLNISPNNRVNSVIPLRSIASRLRKSLCVNKCEKKLVEIYSDAANQAVLKHPDRNYPGVLVQGDELYSFCLLLDDACKNIKENDYDNAYVEINEIRNALWEKLIHYKVVLAEHHIELPFSETP